MAMAATSSWFSVLTSTNTSRYSLSSQRRLATSHKPIPTVTTPKTVNHKRRDKGSSSTGKSIGETESISQKKFPERSKDERLYSYADGSSGRRDMGRSQSTSFKSFDMQRKDKKGFLYDLKEQQVETGNFQDANFLNAVVKVYCTHTAPDYSLPWQKQRQFTSTGSAFMIGDGKLLTNAHCVEHDTQVKVKRRGDDTKYVAKVLARGVECDIALLSVESKEFWKGAEPLHFGRLPHLQPEHNGLSQYPTLRRVLVKSTSHDMCITCESVNVASLLDPMDRDPSHGFRKHRLGIWHFVTLVANIQNQLKNLDSVTVVGYPFGGDTISVTKGVVSRIEVTSYAHGSSELLGIQIDAAINPGNSGGPAFNDQGECIGVAFQVFRSEEAENIGYVIPTTVVSHFLNDYEKNGKYTGFPCLGVLLQKLENPALRACLKVQSNEGVMVRRVEPTSAASNVLKKGDVIVSFDGVNVGCEGTVPFRSNERIAFRYLISQKFAGDVAELGIIRAGASMKVQAVLNPRVHLVPYHIEEGQPSYLIIAGLVFTPLSEPLIDEECEDSIGLKLLAKARYSLARFKGEQIVILSQVLANEVNIGYEDMGNQQVLKFNGARIRNIHHLAYLVDSCKDKYLVFGFEDNYLAVLEREAATAASSCILKGYGIPSERSPDLLEPYVDSLGDNQAIDQDSDDSPVSNLEIGFDGLLWA